jgi:hypothetical protein
VHVAIFEITFKLYLNDTRCLLQENEGDNPELDMKLITMIKKYPSVYDTSCAEYKNIRVKEEIFTQIGEQLGYTGACILICTSRTTVFSLLGFLSCSFQACIRTISCKL